MAAAATGRVLFRAYGTPARFGSSGRILSVGVIERGDVAMALFLRIFGLNAVVLGAATALLLWT
jgi:hypothetical protein